MQNPPKSEFFVRARALQYSRLRSAGHTKCNCALRAQITQSFMPRDFAMIEHTCPIGIFYVILVFRSIFFQTNTIEVLRNIQGGYQRRTDVEEKKYTWVVVGIKVRWVIFIPRGTRRKKEKPTTRLSFCCRWGVYDRRYSTRVDMLRDGRSYTCLHFFDGARQHGYSY